MQTLQDKLQKLQRKTTAGETVTVMIVGLGSVGLYLLDYLVGMADPRLEIVVAGRDAKKMESDVNIVRTAAAIRGTLRSRITIAGGCDLERVESIASILGQYRPDLIINSSRVFAGLKYGTISWHNLRAYGIWTPLSVRYAKNIMEAHEQAGCGAIVINTSYSDAVIPWLRSAGRAYPDFGSGNLNHLIPRMKFHLADRFGIDNLNDIDVTLAVSHFHDVVISKEGQAEGQDILLAASYRGGELRFDRDELLRACRIAMPTDQKRNMMNASSNFNIIESILGAIRGGECRKVHSPGVLGEIGGYPFLIDASRGPAEARFDTARFTMEQMREANRRSIYLDGIEDVREGTLYYTDELLAKADKAFGVRLPKTVRFDEIEPVGEFIIERIIRPNAQ
ncbi:MAG: hypothetical protein IJC16_07580 [Rikenellaceae bacterium]|nr:hypothetical protein [Rikenellaceae bacterium]